MFRVITGLAAIALPGAIVMAWGALTGWVMTDAKLYFFGTLTALMVLVGEGLRLGVYESRIGFKHKKVTKEDYSGITREFLERHGHAPLPYRIGKRVFDVLFGVTVLILLSPIFAIVALLVRFDSPGPSFYGEKRMGFRGQVLVVLRFRTMQLSSDEDSLRGEVTRVGRFLRVTSIDELPQLINVILGSMTIVGPRPLPLRRSLREQSTRPDGYVDAGYELLRYAKPGVTGIAVITGSYPTSVFEYLLHRSFVGDMQILLRSWPRITRL